jgi:hypothetical protein
MVFDNAEILKKLLIEEEVSTPEGFDEDPMGFILRKYTTLNKNLVDLMSKNYKQYLTAVFIVSPKPTTFKVVLHNGQYFFMVYMGEGIYQAIIFGKRYYLSNVGIKGQAMKSISRLLSYGSPLKTKGGEGSEEDSGSAESSGGGASFGGGGGSTGGADSGEETTPEETGTDDTGGDEENLTEQVMLNKIINEILTIREAPTQEQDIKSMLSKSKALSNFAITKIEPVSKDTYRVYFDGVNIKDKKGRSDIMQQIASIPGLKGKIEKGKSSIGYVKLQSKSGIYNILVKGSSETATSTNIKEGFVVLFYYSDINTAITEKNFNSIKKKLQVVVKKIPGVGDKTKVELQQYLASSEYSKQTAALLNQPLSQAIAIKKAYPGKALVRSGIFDEYRQYAHSITGLPSDKWCPGDVYVVLNEAKAQSILATAKKQDPSTAIGVINQAFVSDWGKKNAPLVAVSLKFEKAQGGKAKAYFDKFKAAKTKYNLDSEELNYKSEAYRQGIERLRKSVISYTKGNPNIRYELPDKNTQSISDDKLRGKYAALKAINFFFSEVASAEGVEAIDDALVALAAFAMSLSDTSPSFFKVVGSTKGEAAKVEKFESGTALSLYVDDKIEPIIIKDIATSAGISMTIIASKKGDENIKITIDARNNGMSQGTIEISKIQPIS